MEQRQSQNQTHIVSETNGDVNDGRIGWEGRDIIVGMYGRDMYGHILTEEGVCASGRRGCSLCLSQCIEQRGSDESNLVDLASQEQKVESQVRQKGIGQLKKPRRGVSASMSAQVEEGPTSEGPFVAID